MPPPSDPSQTLTTSKATFLTSQIRLLSTPLTTPLPPPTSNTLPSLPTSTTEKLLTQINKKISSHNRSCYGLESQRHVVEQIDSLYWRDVLADGLPVDVSQVETITRRDRDFTSTSVVEALAEGWADVVLRHHGEGQEPGRGPRRKRRRISIGRGAGDSEEHGGGTRDNDMEVVEGAEDVSGQEQTYHDLRRELLLQTRKRDELRRRIARYKHLQTLLEPLLHPRRDVQPNLVTKDNTELEDEMRKMRVLLARVGSRIQRQSQEETGAQRPERGCVTDVQRLEAVLGLG